MPYEAGHPLPNTARNTNFGAATNKLATITTRTTTDTVLLDNVNATTTAGANKTLPSTLVSGGIAFDTFQLVVSTLTVPSS